MSSRVRLIIALLAALIPTILMVWLTCASAKYFDLVSDLPEYIVAGKMLANGQGGQLYNEKIVAQNRKELFPLLRERGGLTVYSPPPAILLFFPLALLPISLCKIFWQPFLFLAYAVSILLLKNAYELSLRAAAWLWSVAFFLGPLFEALKIGQLSTLLTMALCLSIFLFKRKHDFAAGLMLFAFVLKPQEILTFLMFLAGAGRWSALLGFASACALLGIVSIFACGINAYQGFFQMSANLSAYKNLMLPQLSPTIKGQLLRLDLDPTLTSILGISALVLGAVLSFMLGKKMAKSPFYLEAGLGVALPLGLATALLLHSYDLILLLPVMLALLNSPLQTRLPSYVSASAVFLLFAVFSLPAFLPMHYKWVLGTAPLNPFALTLILLSSCTLFMAFKYAGDWQKDD